MSYALEWNRPHKLFSFHAFHIKWYKFILRLLWLLP
jgi:hypothetical protein